jgi:predicted HNH restriction endonuclease
LKSFAVNQSTYQRKWIDLVEEVDKCFLLCSNCHREVHTHNEPAFIKSNPKGVL